MSTKTKEFTLAVQIAGSINKSFKNSLNTASTSLNGFQKKVNNLNSTFTNLDKGYSNIMNAGKKAFSVVTSAAVVATAAVTGVTAAAVVVGKEFETAFAGVKKTVDATEEEYAKLKKDIIDMSLAIPSSAVEIAGVMEIAGQLGIANANLTEFTQTMINLGVSTNLSATDAATALAKFANITQMDPSNYERLGSTIVELGNNFATTESEIVEMATRLAAAGELTGLTESQILALATAMSSVGIASESGGSTMSKLLKKMQIAVETNSESLGEWANVANMSVEQFKTAFKDDAIVALSAFIDGLNDTERLGKSAIVVLDEMDLSEVRLSNTILSLANSSGSMSSAIEMANNAWEENIALQEEANKRYETTDSKIQIMKNSFVKLGIAAYDELQEPLNNVIGNITEGVQGFTEYASGPNGISKWIENLSTKWPTVLRKVKGAIKEFLNFFSPVIDAAKWLWDHPDCIAAAFVAIGTALAAYKIASTLTHIVTSLKTLAANKVALGIVGVATAIGLVAGAVYYLNKQHEKMIKAKIDKAFGDIALSLEDIEEVANHLINNDGVLTKLHEAIGAFEELDTIQDSINNAMSVINKTHWKVSIGMELSEDETISYKEAIASYVSECQNYVSQQQYSLTLAVSLAYDKEDAMGMSIIDSINQFYTDNLTELQSIGTKLNEAITDAFTDGLLDIDEAKEIQELLQQTADIQSALSKSNFNAALTSLSLDYGLASGIALDADSFANLQAEVNEQLAAFKTENNTARDKLIQNAALRLDQGYLTQEQYDAEVASIAEKYNALYAEKVAAAQEFMLNTISDTGLIEDAYKEAYNTVEDILKQASPNLFSEHVKEMTAEGINSELSYAYNQWSVESSAQGILDEAAEAVDKLLEQVKPLYDDLVEQQEYYESIGKQVPEYITKGITDYEKLEELKTATDLPLQMVYDVITQSEYGTYIEDTLQEAGKSIDRRYALGIKEGTPIVTDAVDEMYNTVLEHIKGKKSFKLPNANEFSIYGSSTVIDPLGNNKLPDIPGHADGGIFTVPHIAAFAEKGPESAIPLDGSANAIRLWERTGQLLGMESRLDDVSLEGNSRVSIEYKPNLIFNGQAPSQSELESAMRTSQDEFEAMMNRYLKEHRRVAF